MTPAENAALKRRLIEAGTLVLLSPAEILSLHLSWVHPERAHPGGTDMASLQRAHRQIMLLRGPQVSCSYFTDAAEEKAS